MSRSDAMQLFRDSFAAKTLELNLSRKGLKDSMINSASNFEAFWHYIEKMAVDEALLFVKMKAIHSSHVFGAGTDILESMREAAETNPDGLAMTNDENILKGLTNKQTFEIVKKYMADYEFALMGHDIGRCFEHDDKGTPNFKLHPYLSFQNTPQLSDVARLAIINHGYPTAGDMYAKLDSRDEAVQASCSKGHAEWMKTLQLEAHEKYQAMTYEQKIATALISNMVRDADKLGNWRGVVAWGQQEDTPTMRRIYDLPHGRKGTIALADSEMRAARENRVINYYKDCTNFNGMNLAVLMWSADFSLQSTSQTAAKSNLALDLINYMDEWSRQHAAEDKKSEEYAQFLKQLGEIFNIFQERGFIGSKDKFDIAERMKTYMQFESGKLKFPILSGDGINKYKKMEVESQFSK